MNTNSEELKDPHLYKPGQLLCFLCIKHLDLIIKTGVGPEQDIVCLECFNSEIMIRDSVYFFELKLIVPMHNVVLFDQPNGLIMATVFPQKEG